METGRARATAIVTDVLFMAALSTGGLVLGACVLGLLGPRLLGSRGGHGLANLEYLFTGALVGAVGGMTVGLARRTAWSLRRKLVGSLVALFVGAAAVGIHVVVASITCGW